jgi:hypothetical protein
MISQGLVERGLQSEEDTARMLCVAKDTLKQWRCKGFGPAFLKLGKSVFYRTADVDEWISQQRRVPHRTAA